MTMKKGTTTARDNSTAKKKQEILISGNRGNSSILMFRYHILLLFIGKSVDARAETRLIIPH